MSSTPKKAPKANMDDVHAALQALIAQGKKDGMIRASDLNAQLEKMQLTPAAPGESAQRRWSCSPPGATG